MGTLERGEEHSIHFGRSGTEKDSERDGGALSSPSPSRSKDAPMQSASACRLCTCTGPPTVSNTWPCPPFLLISLSRRKDQDPFLAGIKVIEWKRPEDIGNPKATPVVCHIGMRERR